MEKFTQANNKEATKVLYNCPDSKVHVAKMRPTRVLLAQGGPHVGPIKLAIRVTLCAGNLPVIVMTQRATIGDSASIL